MACNRLALVLGMLLTTAACQPQDTSQTGRAAPGLTSPPIFSCSVPLRSTMKVAGKVATPYRSVVVFRGVGHQRIGHVQPVADVGDHRVILAHVHRDDRLL